MPKASLTKLPTPAPTPAPVTQTAFDYNGNLNLGIVDPNATLPDQVGQLGASLVAQGLSPTDASNIAWQRLAPLPDPFSISADTDEPSFADRIADQIGVPRGDVVNAGLGADLMRSGEFLFGLAEGVGFSALATLEGLAEVAKSPLQFARGVKELLTSAEARSQFSKEFIDRVRVDVQMLEDAFNAGDMRGTGQQLGKLTADFAQLAGGAAALAKLGVTAASAGGRLLIGTAEALAPGLARVREVFARAGVQVPDDVAVRIASNFGREGDAFTQAAEQMARARSAGWKTAEGKVWWPPIDGAVPGTQFMTTVKPGTVLDRFGGTSSTSTFLAPVETTLAERALAPFVNTAVWDQYVVLRELPVEQSTVMPWFGQSGMGIQYNTARGIEQTIAWLVERKYLRKVTP